MSEKKYYGNTKKTTEQFIEEAKKIHGNKFDYSKVEYINARTKVCIICPKHGEFWQTPDSHLRGRGCKKCGVEQTSNQRKIWNYDNCFEIAVTCTTLNELRNKYNAVYIVSLKNGWINNYFWLKKSRKENGFYNDYNNCRTVALQCKNASEFKELFGNAWLYAQQNGWLDDFFPKKQNKTHWNEENSINEAKKYKTKKEFQKKCSGAYKFICKNKLMNKCTWFLKIKKDNTKLVQNYIEQSTQKYNGFYNYSQIDINNIKQVTKTKVPIVCSEHGVFYQTLYSHLNCVCPCPFCRKNIKTNRNGNKIQTVIQDRMEHGIVYCYTNKKNGKKYIGQTINEKRRKNDHLKQNQKYKTLFDKILQKEGKENFTYEILYNVVEMRSKIFNILNEKEKYFIQLYNTQLPNGYNISEGGKSVKWMSGYKPTEETIQKLRDSHKGQIPFMKGKHYSEDQKQEILKKRKETFKKKYEDGYIAQRENISVFLKIDTKYEFLNTFPNAKEIERQMNINYKTVHYILKRGTPLNNKYIFVYSSDCDQELIDKISQRPSSFTKCKEVKYVVQIDKNNNAVGLYKLNEATKRFGKHVSDVCNGRCKTAYGFKWAYKDEYDLKNNINE